MLLETDGPLFFNPGCGPSLYNPEKGEQMPCKHIAVYCISCIKSMYIGGRTHRYLIDLLFGEDTQAQEYRGEKWHGILDAYIAAH